MGQLRVQQADGVAPRAESARPILYACFPRYLGDFVLWNKIANLPQKVKPTTCWFDAFFVFHPCRVAGSKRQAKTFCIFCGMAVRWIRGADSSTATSEFGFRNSFVFRNSEFGIRICLGFSQIEGKGALSIRLGRRDVHRTGCVADLEEASQTAAFGLVGVHGQSVVVATAWMRDVIGTTSDGAPVPTIHDVEDERRVRANGRLQTFRR